MSHYESDESTLVDDERRGRQTRQRSYSEDGPNPRQAYREQYLRGDRKSDSKLATIGTVALVVGVIGGVMWYKDKKARKEREYRREKEYRRNRRREFERAKTARRREEERLEREIERDDSLSPHREMRLIEDAPRGSRARSPSREARKLDQPPPRSGRASRRGSMDSWDSLSDVDYDRGRRQASRVR